MNPALIALAIQETPAVIEALKRVFTRRNPDLPAPTSVEVILAFNQAFESSLAKDELWLRTHPE